MKDDEREYEKVKSEENKHMNVSERGNSVHRNPVAFH